MSGLINLALNRSAQVFRTQASRFWQNPGIIFNVKNSFISSKGIFSFHTNYSRFQQNTTKSFCTKAYDINTNVSKDVIMFKYENPRFFKMLNIFAICQFIFWNYLSHFAFTTLKDAPVKEKADGELVWYQRINLGDNKYRNAITIFCFMIGYGILFASWMFTLRSVRYLILRKGGKDVSFVTYTPFGQNRIMTVPLKNVSAQESREIARVHLPIKVQSRAFFYIVDMRGEFRNPKLFDHTAGLKRRLL